MRRICKLKRYTGKTEGSLLGSPHWEHPEGEWVKWEDYACLQAEVERLRKAGDELAQEIIGCYRGEGYDPADSETLPKWYAAKEDSSR